MKMMGKSVHSREKSVTVGRKNMNVRGQVVVTIKNVAVNAVIFIASIVAGFFHANNNAVRLVSMTRWYIR